ncbi:MAG TPA: hypothetical protein VGW33_08865 [Terriglobia bacterium]|nr:hypothetical protein [Terriglobia bacterium]
MTFEEAGRAMDREVGKLVKMIEQKVKTSGRRDAADMLRRASEQLAKLAANLEKPGKR